MKINYIDYDKDIFAEVLSNLGTHLYVFDNFQNMIKMRELYDKPFLQRQSRFITMNDLKEKLFPTEKLIIREEKLSILLYEVLSDYDKEKLGIDNYFDCIDFSAKLFKFYKELHEYKIDELDNLKKWQREKYELIQSIYDSFKSKLAELNYTNSTLLFDFDYFNDY
ncbi:MAG: PD-(D/E)XK nuclease family protein, partial [Bacillota bacterium]